MFSPYGRPMPGQLIHPVKVTSLFSVPTTSYFRMLRQNILLLNLFVNQRIRTDVGS